MGSPRPRISRRTVMIMAVALLAIGSIAAAEGTGAGTRLARWTVAAGAWWGTSPEVGGQGNVGPGGPIGVSQSPETRLQLGFWPGSVAPDTPGPTPTPTATPTASPIRSHWLPLVVRQ